MTPGAVVIDAQLLMIVVVGGTDRRLIASHKRLTGYSEDDFDLVAALLREFDDDVVVPNVLSEVSNLSRQIGGPAKRGVAGTLAQLVEAVEERYVPSVLAVRREEFLSLGLTDAVLRRCARSASRASRRRC